ncbi:MAG: hypothetical protein OEV52_03630 [Dehalococcoidia bacterium]|nr:hypothetical protein [Dehalococcoidia bacterium]
MIDGVKCPIARIVFSIIEDISAGLTTRHNPDRDIIGIELIDSMSMAQSSELCDGVVLNHSRDRKTISVGERGTEKGLLPQAPEPTSSPVTGEN